MINGFEEITAQLNDYEKVSLLPVLIQMLNKRVGPKKAIKNNEIVNNIRNLGMKITEARVRKIINYIRMNGLVEKLIATNKGYYISNNMAEINSYIESLKQRADSILAVRYQLSKQLDNNLTQQEINF